MKAASLITTLFMLINTIFCTNPEYKKAFDSQMSKCYYGYNINMGEIAGTEAARKLNEHRSEIVEYINSMAQSEKERVNNANVDKSYEIGYDLLTEDDIDFNDTEKVKTYSLYGSYTNYEYDVTYDKLMYKVTPIGGAHRWIFSIRKDCTVYEGIIEQDGAIDEKNVLELDDGFEVYVDHISRSSSDDSEYMCLGEVFKTSAARLLYEKGEQCKDIDVVIVNFDVGVKTAGVVFIDGKAKYIVCYGFYIPAQNLREDTPKEIRDYLTEMKDRMYCNTKKDKYKLDELYSFNEVMYMIDLVNEWTNEYGWSGWY